MLTASFHSQQRTIVCGSLIGTNSGQECNSQEYKLQKTSGFHSQQSTLHSSVNYKRPLSWKQVLSVSWSDCVAHFTGFAINLKSIGFCNILLWWTPVYIESLKCFRHKMETCFRIGRLDKFALTINTDTPWMFREIRKAGTFVYFCSKKVFKLNRSISLFFSAQKRSFSWIDPSPRPSLCSIISSFSLEQFDQGMMSRNTKWFFKIWWKYLGFWF